VTEAAFDTELGGGSFADVNDEDFEESAGASAGGASAGASAGGASTGGASTGVAAFEKERPILLSHTTNFVKDIALGLKK
jgi:hypothetical protein